MNAAPLPSGEFYVELYDLFQSPQALNALLQSCLVSFVRGMNACLNTSFVCPEPNAWLRTTLMQDGIVFYDLDKKHSIYCSGDSCSRYVLSKTLSVSKTFLDSSVRVMWLDFLNRVTLLYSIYDWTRQFGRRVVGQLEMCKWSAMNSNHITYIDQIHVQYLREEEEKQDTRGTAGWEHILKQQRRVVRKSLRRYVFDVNDRPVFKRFLETFSPNKKWFMSLLEYHAQSSSITCYACEK